MPTISIFFGITVQMYWRDHPPPHVHVFYGGAEALLSNWDRARLLEPLEQVPGADAE